MPRKPAPAAGELQQLNLLVPRAFEILTQAAREIRETNMSEKAIQDYYPDNVSHCYGCGRLNERGLQIKSYWLGDEAVCIYQPRPEHTAIPGYVYGGLIASLIDCHCTGTAAAASYQAAGRAMDSLPAFPLCDRLAQGGLSQTHPVRRAVGSARPGDRDQRAQSGHASQPVCRGQVCARGEVVAVQAPPAMFGE